MNAVILQEDFRRLVEEQLSDQQLSRSELARRMNVTPSYVGDYLNGRNSPGPDVMERFFSALGVKARIVIERESKEAATKSREHVPAA
jgi:transcriptional regulator with XRE-family HTH domain